MSKPVLDPATPFLDRVLIAHLYRLQQESEDIASRITAGKAVEAALAVIPRGGAE